MGLAERRAAKNFETSHFPKLRKEVEDAAGFAMPVDVDWDSLTTEGESHLYGECWPKVYFEPLAHAFRDICVDEMGKEALKKGLKRIRIQNKLNVYSGESCASFESGVLTIDHLPTSNVDDVNLRSRGIQKMLEAAL